MEKGDFVKITYEMRLGEDKKLVSTNDEKLAKDNDIYDPDQKYGPGTLIVGDESIFKEINESLQSISVGETKEVEIKAENAYGLRDPKNIQVHTMAEFKRNKIDPYPGQEVKLGNRRGRVISVSPGRVVVDYNHQFAGKDVFYKYTVIEKLEKLEDKVKSLIDMNFSKGSENFKVIDEGNVVSIYVPEDLRYNIEWFDAKYRIVENFRKYMVNKILDIIEEYEPKKENNKDETSKEEKNQTSGETNVEQEQKE